jgi:hypothetical protein
MINFLPQPPTRVARGAGLAPEDPEKVLNPRYMLKWLVCTRARPLLTCVAANSKQRTDFELGALQPEKGIPITRDNPVTRGLSRDGSDWNTSCISFHLPFLAVEFTQR